MTTLDSGRNVNTEKQHGEGACNSKQQICISSDQAENIHLVLTLILHALLLSAGYSWGYGTRGLRTPNVQWAADPSCYKTHKCSTRRIMYLAPASSRFRPGIGCGEVRG